MLSYHIFYRSHLQVRENSRPFVILVSQAILNLPRHSLYTTLIVMSRSQSKQYLYPS